MLWGCCAGGANQRQPPAKRVSRLLFTPAQRSSISLLLPHSCAIDPRLPLLVFSLLRTAPQRRLSYFSTVARAIAPHLKLTEPQGSPPRSVSALPRNWLPLGSGSLSSLPPSFSPFSPQPSFSSLFLLPFFLPLCFSFSLSFLSSFL